MVKSIANRFELILKKYPQFAKRFHQRPVVNKSPTSNRTSFLVKHVYLKKSIDNQPSPAAQARVKEMISKFALPPKHLRSWIPTQNKSRVVIKTRVGLSARLVNLQTGEIVSVCQIVATESTFLRAFDLASDKLLQEILKNTQ